MPGTRLDKDDMTPTLGTDPGNPFRLASQGQEPRSEVAVITDSSGSNPNWQKLIFECLLRVVPDDKIETQRLMRQAKGYLIHDNELYHRTTLGILQ
jgi:hypothetical protein